MKYPFIKEGSTKYSAYCKKCNCEVSISNGGVTSIEKHVKTDKHKNNSLASVASLKLTEHFRRKLLGRPEKELAAAEGLFAFHTVKHNQSFKYSLDLHRNLNNEKMWGTDALLVLAGHWIALPSSFVPCLRRSSHAVGRRLRKLFKMLYIRTLLPF